jgi:hypothetical protein
MKDVLDQYETVARISEAQMRFQQGVPEFYRARTDTKMTIAAERLAVIAAITLPITSLSSVMGPLSSSTPHQLLGLGSSADSTEHK